MRVIHAIYNISFVIFCSTNECGYLEISSFTCSVILFYMQLFGEIYEWMNLWFVKVFSGHQELLDSGLCDVLVVSTPNMTHYTILMDIINHSKPHHVLVEKPLCTTVSHCKQVCFSCLTFFKLFSAFGKMNGLHGKKGFVILISCLCSCFSSRIGIWRLPLLWLCAMQFRY